MACGKCGAKRGHFPGCPSYTGKRAGRPAKGTRTRTCSWCGGTGKNKRGNNCIRCDGTGKVKNV